MKKIIFIFGIVIITFIGLVNGQESVHLIQELINVRVVGQTETSCRMVIEITGEVKFHVFKVTNPPRLVVEMVDVVHNWSKKEIEVGGNLIKRIRSGQYKDEPVKIVRVVLDMAVEDYYYEEVSTKNQVTIAIELPGEEVKKIKAKKRVDTRYTVMRKKLEPNIPTQEHKENIARILEEKREREKEKRKRLKKISKIRKEVSPWEEEISISMFGASGKEPVDFNFKDADIKEVLRGFAIRLNKNIIPSPGVSGKVDLRLKGVPFDVAFKMLLDRSNLIAIQKSPNVIEVMGKDEMPIQRKIFHLYRRNAGDIQATLQGLLTTQESADTTIAVDEASNSLIVTANADVLSKIELLVRQLDIKAPQIMIKARIIEVQAGEDFSSGVSWLGSIPFDDKTADIATGRTMGKYIAPRFGKDAADFDASWYKPTHRMDVDEFATYPTGGYFGISAIMDKLDLHATLNFLASNAKAKTISEPTILTENNKTAKIHVGRNLPVRTMLVTETGTVESVEFIPEGVDLCVTPVVSPGSTQISLKVKVSVSEFVGWQANNPITTDRSAETEVTVESGKTIVIGGLIKERVSITNSGIPLLKDIPLIGYLFKNKTTAKTRTELLIFLTPEILID